MGKSQTMTSLFITIESPSDGASVSGNLLTVTGTARALRETISGGGKQTFKPLDPLDPDPKIPPVYPDPPSAGATPNQPLPGSESSLPPSGPGTIKVPEANDSITDVTHLIQRVQVKVETTLGTGVFRPATQAGEANAPWSRWTFNAELPSIFRTATITAQVEMGFDKGSTSIRVAGIRRV